MNEATKMELQQASGDYIVPAEFATVSKESIQSNAGVKFKEFRRTLEPRFGVVWLHIFSAYAVLVLVAFGLTGLVGASLGVSLLCTLLGGFIFGYTIAFIQLFFHEAAHYNLAAKKSTSDFLANMFIGAIVGQDIKNYRPIHWGHHKWLGSTMDTEQTYFDPLDTKFIVQSLLGIKVLSVLSKREENLQTDAGKKQSMIGLQFIIGALMNGAIVIGSLYFNYWELAVAWTIGMLIVFPFFASVRQVLEHRDENAKRDVDYHNVAHGVINRLFGDGLIADTLGGAGFNRHLLHHWDPQVSYTRLKDLELYLMDTPLADALKSRQTTYVKTFIRLFNN